MMSETREASRANESRMGLSPFWRRILIYAAALVGVFLLGLVPMWLTARARADERDAARAELRLSQMQNRLASAAIEARRGEYELARQAASDFFTGLRAGIERADDSSALTAQQRDSLRPILNGRDDLITLLARSDPAAADRLTDLYVAYRNAVASASSSPPRQQ